MNIQILGFFSGLCLLISMVVCFLPKPLAGLIAAMFSYGKLGVRYAQRYRDNRDKLGYLFLLIGFIYSIIFIFIPYQIEKYVFSGIYGYFFLITIAQYYRVYKEERILKRFAALSAICVMASVNYIACVGVLNNFGFMGPCAMFGKNVIDGSFLHLTYYLANMNFMAYFTSFFLYMFAFYCLIAQFKYLRLEDHYKAKNPVFLWFKVLLISAIMMGISYLGFIGIKFVFNVK